MGTVSQASLNMKAFVIVALVAAVAGEADPYTIGQVLAGQTNGGVITSTTYHGGLKVPGFAGLYAGVPQVAATIPKTVVAVVYQISAGPCCCSCCSCWVASGRCKP